MLRDFVNSRKWCHLVLVLVWGCLKWHPPLYGKREMKETINLHDMLNETSWSKINHQEIIQVGAPG